MKEIATYDEIGLQFCDVNIYDKLYLEVAGSYKTKKPELKLYVDNKEQKVNIIYLDENEFYFMFELSDIAKELELKVKENKEEKRLAYRKINKFKIKLRNLLKRRKTATISDIGIAYCTVTGLRNSLLTIRGTNANQDNKIEIYTSNDEKIEFDQLNYPTGDFLITSKLPSHAKEILVYYIYNGEKILIAYRKNVFIKKLLRKIIEIIKKILRKIIKVFMIIPRFFKVMYRGLKFLWREHHFIVPPRYWKKYWDRLKYRMKHSNDQFYDPFNVEEYNQWLKENEEETVYEELKYKPLISFLIPVYNIGREYLSDCIESILNQSYENFEICLVDDCSTKQETKEALEEYSKKDKRIRVKYRKENGHISKTTNDALSMAKGEFVALIDDDDILDKDALYYNVLELNKDKTIDMLYSDEDKINLKKEYCDPNFKSDFAPDSLLSSNYICHFTVLRKSIMDKIGGERSEYDGAQDYDLFLRFSEQTNNIKHIPRILYHWRMVEGSTSMVIDNKGYALERGRLAIEDALKRRKIKGKVFKAEDCPYYYIEYEVPKDAFVSIIIPTKDLASTLDTCLKSVYEKSTYKNFEIIVVNNNSVEEETFELFKKYKKEHKNFKVIDANIEFNYSKINNMAVKVAKGDYICLLNNDIEVITPNWMELMIGYASQKHIGAVGAKLSYPDNTIQHSGVILGMGGVAGHAYIGYPRNAVIWGGRLSVPYDYGAVTAACLMITKKKFNEVKGLEENLKVAFNDVDFNLKLLQKGYYNVCNNRVEMYHYESKSRGLDNTSEKYKRFLQEHDYMIEHWQDELLNDRFYNPNFSLKERYVLEKKEER